MPFNKASYDQWRASIPWTDDQIAAIFERDAARVTVPFLKARWEYRAKRIRQGFLSTRDLVYALDALITTCVVCGKKALYRSGQIGMCSTHRDYRSSAALQKQQRLNLRQADIIAARKARDYKDLAKLDWTKTCGPNQKKNRR